MPHTPPESVKANKSEILEFVMKASDFTILAK
jgi:hypothetical protein